MIVSLKGKGRKPHSRPPGSMEGSPIRTSRLAPCSYLAEVLQTNKTVSEDPRLIGGRR